MEEPRDDSTDRRGTAEDTSHAELTSDTGLHRVAGVSFGCGPLAIALLAGANTLNLGLALVVGTGGSLGLQRVRRTGVDYRIDLWGRVLGP